VNAVSPPPGWYADPLQRFEQRFWDGVQWTDRIRMGQSEGADPMGVEPNPEPEPASSEGAPVGAQPGAAVDPLPASGAVCQRCGRVVRINAAQYAASRGMHWVCFHFEFQHDPFDPDEPCAHPQCPARVLRPA
jgi:Protein of unknown function (DUF2510)